MSETTQLIATIKKKLKSQGITYRDLAQKLDLSEPSIKRILTSGRLTIDRLMQISDLLGYTLAELAKEATSEQPRLRTLTEKQEHEIVSEPQLLIVAVCALNHWTSDEIVEYYQLTQAACIKYLLRLDKLRIIDLLPNNRIRINVARDFDWLPFGPIKQYFQSKGLPDFLASNFAQEDETMAFVHGMFSDHARSQMQDELRRLRQKFAELHEASLSVPLGKRSGIGLLLATRKWEPNDFRKLRRA
ncbi:MAG: helix-turn-helix transcriptional regulator [Gallionella sp.]|nr:helix-turn-helix transcriptional regulator [Gallionella sp.]